MPTAYDIAGAQYAAPNNGSPEPQRAGIKYSIYAGEILRFLAVHRIALASHVQRALPHCFASDRSARRHLQTLADEGDVDILTYDDPRRPNVYLITGQGLDRACDFMRVVPESVPARRDDPKGDHVLHELLITEVAVARYEFFRADRDHKHLWEERFGLHTIAAFADVVPDYAQAYRSPHGCLIDFVEVLSGERSITRVQEKLQRWADWSESEAGQDFLLQSYRYFRAQNPRPVFRINIVAHNRNLVGTDHGWERRVLNATFRVPADLQRRVWTTTNAALRHSKGIDSAVWRCAAMLVPHRARWQDTPKSKRLHYLSGVLTSVPAMKLFSFEP